MMNNQLPEWTAAEKKLFERWESLQAEFLELYTQHKHMVESESFILQSLYLEKIGRYQLQLLQKQTEAASLRMKMKMIQAAINRNEKPNMYAIEQEINKRMQAYYQKIKEQAAALEQAKKVLSNLLSVEESQKLKEIFRLLCKKLHPDLNPHLTEEEKDLFIKVKAAYDLQNLSELQNILLYLQDDLKGKVSQLSSDQKEQHIQQLSDQIQDLKNKIEQLLNNFPFNMKSLLKSDKEIEMHQEEIKIQIDNAQRDVEKYSEIIILMLDVQ